MVMGDLGKPRLLAGAFSIYELIVADWVKLIGQLYLVCFDRVRWVWYLTDVLLVFFGGKILSRYWRRRFIVPPIRLRSGLHSGLRQSGGASFEARCCGTASSRAIK